MGDKSGSVLIVGGGIAGMQSALDLAETGFKVFLLEKDTSIGGVMVRLDKTFPTNDCSLCIVSPKMVEVARHPNIEVLSGAKVKKVEGEPGNFKVTVEKKARFIDTSKCTGCGECTKVCPVDVENPFEGGLSKRKAVYRNFASAVPSAFAIDKRGTSPCKVACPAHISVQGYVALAAQGRLEEALNLIKENAPFPGVLGRVCPAFCEKACTRGEVDGPIHIKALKRYIYDKLRENNIRPVPEKKEPKDKKVAIIGAGPAGLTCAYYLAIEGYKVTIFEAEDKPGGMMRYGIPSYRLPRDVLDDEISYLNELGVEFKFSHRLGKDFTIDDLLSSGFDAVFLAIGAHKHRKMGIEGEDLIKPGVDFLKRVNRGESVEVGKKVAVVGGGNVAMDCSRVSKRLGAEEVTILYRRSREEMPASDEEIEEALEEGIKIEFLTAPVKVEKSGDRIKVTCIRMKLGEPDASGRRKPIPIEGSEFTIEVDDIISAIGEIPDPETISSTGLETTEWGTIKVDELTLQTSNEKVFAGGDVVMGPSTVIEAIAHGKRAAISIDRFLKGEDLREGRDKELKFEEVDKKEVLKENPVREEDEKPRLHIKRKAPEERVRGFSEVNFCLTDEEAKYEAERCLNCGICSECYRCVYACPANAIDHSMKDEEVDLTVGGIILSPGFSIYDARNKPQYGFGVYKNVVTSIQFERILSASGPYQGHVQRPSDGKEPKRIAFIQCVGSRDKNSNTYCSSVCCMYATKEAIVAKEHLKGVDTTIFLLDMRAFGKDFDKYYERAIKEYGVRYIRCMVSSIKEDPETKNLKIAYLDENGEVKEEEFDLVVLSVGLAAPEDAPILKEKFGIELNKHGFCKTDPTDPLQAREGIYICGAFAGPKDIPETVMEASGAACKAEMLLHDVRGTQVKKQELPPEKDVRGIPPRIGVFVCRCGINIASVVDVEKVAEYAKTLPFVKHSEVLMFTCSEDAQERIKQAIEEYNLNRVVVASCSPRTHQPLFENTIREAGLNRFLFEMANIRDQCSWVHMNEPEEATEKAKDLVREAVYKAVFLEPLETAKFGVKRAALVVGGGLAGMISSIALAEQGFEVFLVEKEKELGGNLRHKYYTVDGMDVQEFLKHLISRVTSDKRIKVFTGAEIENIDGYVGNYVTTINIGSEQKTVEHGVVIVATGGTEYKPSEYFYGEDKRVITQSELEEKLARDDIKSEDLKEVVMIQCVGSRNEERPYCSRYCCIAAVKNALKIKEKNPDAKVYVLYREMRTYGFTEDYYLMAREKGVIFVRFRDDQYPSVEKKEGKLLVRVVDESTGIKIELNPTMLVLSTAILPNPENEKLAKMLKVPINKEGFFLEAHMKLRPVDFATDGVFMCGLSHYPKRINETIVQAYAAASRAATILTKDQLESEGRIAHVNEAKCIFCGLCTQNCPFGAVELDYEKQVARVNEALCKGCGVCAASCRVGAIDVRGFSDTQIVSVLEAI